MLSRDCSIIFIITNHSNKRILYIAYKIPKYNQNPFHVVDRKAGLKYRVM